MQQKLRFLLLFLFFAAVQLSLQAQDIRWYFGNSPNGLLWDNSLDLQLEDDQQTPFGSAGAAVANDPVSGALLFYTDGQHLYAGNHAQISNNLGGDLSKTNPVMLVPVAGEPNQYYIIINKPDHTLAYFIYDYVAQSLLSGPTPINGLSNAAGAMELIRQTDQFGYWLVVPLRNSAQIQLISIDANGISVNPAINLSSSMPALTAFSLSYNPDNAILALGGSNGDDAQTYLLRMDTRNNQAAASRLSMLDTLKAINSQNGNISGLAWAGNYLYVAKSNNAINSQGALWRADIPAVLTSLDSIPYLPEEIASFTRLHGLKRGPDGYVYALYENGSGQQLGRVARPQAARPNFEATLFNGLSFAGTQFPQLAPPPFEDASAAFDVVGLCLDNPTYFYPEFDDNAPDSVRWNFGDDSEGSGLQLSHTYAQGGNTSFTVTMQAFYPGNTVSSQRTLSLSQAPQLQLPAEIVLCPQADSVMKPTITDANGQDVSDQYSLTWYRPISSEKTLGSDETVTQVADSITVQALSVVENGATIYPEAGTYYVVASPTSGTLGCELYATSRVIVYEVESQKTNTWYFGNGAGLDFNAQPPMAVDQSQMRGADQAPEGTAIEADANSDILLYTNGAGLWFGRDLDNNGQDDKAANGADIGGSTTATQSSLIVPFGSDATLFYVFTTNEDGSFRYTVADLKALDVEAADLDAGQFIRGRLLREAASEKLTAITGDSSGVWVLTHELGTNRFVAIPVGGEGIGNPVYSRAGSVHTDANSAGYMRFSEDGEFLAVTLPGEKAIEVFRFDTETGRVENTSVRIPLSDASGTLYGLEFSGTRLYATTTSAFGGGNSQLYQFTVDSAFVEADILASKVRIGEDAAAWGAVQLAPDGQLYMAIDGATQLATYAAPSDSAASASGTVRELQFDQAPLLAGGTNSLLGLPNFIRRAGESIPDATVSALSACEGEPIQLTGQRRYSNETYRFEVYKEGQLISTIDTGETSDTLISINEIPELTAGNYRVNLILLSECGEFPGPGEEPVQAEFEIFGIPEARVDNPSQAFCENQSITFTAEALMNGTVADPAVHTFVWIDALSGSQVASGQEFTTEEAGAWLLVVYNNETGCESEPLNVEALEQRPEANLGNDMLLCVGDPLPQNQLSLQLANPADFNIRWLLSENGATFQELNNTGTSQDLDAVNTSQGGSYRYLVEIRSTDASQSCFRADTLSISINQTPSVSIIPSGNSCSGSTVLTAQVEGIATDSLSYEFFGPNGSFGLSNSPSITATESGTYSVRIVQGDNSCEASSAEIEIDVFGGISDLTVDVYPGCGYEDELAQNLLVARTSYTGPVTYQWRNMDTNQPTGPGRTHVGPDSLNASDGTYQVTARIENDQCTENYAEFTVTVNRTKVPREALQEVYMICPDIPELSSYTLSLPGFTQYQWRLRSTGQVLSTSETFTLSQEGEYELLLDECSIPIPFNAVYNCTPRLWVPNAIRVNGKNPVFKILNPGMLDGVENFQLLIFNRWGEVIFQSSDPNFSWFGEDSSGKLVMTGTYPYLMTYTNLYGENPGPQKQRGGVTVLH